MRDVVKTNVKRQQSSKRKHRRTRHQAINILIVALLVIGVGVSLSMTFFFNVTRIEVNNATHYDDNRVVALSGIKGGENLVRLDTGFSAKNIRESLVYAEEVSVNKKFPSTVEIVVTKSEPIANITYSFGYLLVSSSGKILETVEKPQEGLLIIKGYDPATDTPGQILESKVPEKNAVFNTLSAAVAKNPDAGVYSLDMSDIYEIQVQFGDKVKFEMGNSNEAAYKLKFASSVIQTLNPDKGYHLKMVGNNQISEISDDSAQVLHTLPANQTAETTTNSGE